MQGSKKAKILVAGDSFATVYNGAYKGWAQMLAEHYSVKNVAQAGVGQYKILKQIQKQNLNKFNTLVISHTSPYRIHTATHPLHQQGFHKNCDFIYEDVKGRLPDVEKFFTEYFDLDYANCIHNLLKKEIDSIINKYEINVIDTESLELRKVFKTNRGQVQHLDEVGNKLIYKRLQERL